MSRKSYARQVPSVTIDLRMLSHGGVGTYVGNLIPRILAHSEGHMKFHLLGSAPIVANLVNSIRGDISFKDVSTPIYTIREQFSLAFHTPPKTDLFWSPHYNIPCMRRGKLLVTIHDVNHLAMPRLLNGLLKRTYARAMFWAIKNKAQAILCVSEFTKNELLKYTGLSEDRLAVVHNGVDESWFGVRRSISPRARPYLLCVGSVKPHKNLGKLLDAFEIVKDHVPHDLVVVGKIEGFITGDDEFVRRAKLLSDRVCLTGPVSLDQLQQFYAHAEALVVPSLYEGFGLPLLEAMACGCPVLASEAASIPEVGGDAALYFNPFDPRDIADKILLLCGDSTMRHDLYAKGSVRARLFSWDEAATKTLRVIENLLTK